jgi:hypothetical protein
MGHALVDQGAERSRTLLTGENRVVAKNGMTRGIYEGSDVSIIYVGWPAISCDLDGCILANLRPV